MVLRACYMAAGNRRAARQPTTGDGRVWITNLASDVLGWERDLTEDGDVESQPGPRAEARKGSKAGSSHHRPTRDRRAWTRDLTKDGD
eukprot:12487718-Alexandrium_andersonii.AAC.1